jgi:hypothetical protein
VKRPASRRTWHSIKEYGIGLAGGAACTLYGLYALASRRAYLPGLKGGTATVQGSHGVGAAALYLAGGLFLVLRLFLHRRCRSEFARRQVYLLENCLLLAFIGAAFYVLLNVGTAG